MLDFQSMQELLIC